MIRRMNTVDSETEKPHAFPQVLHVRSHTFRADVTAPSGSTDSAPGPQRVEAHVDRDDSDEHKGTYKLTLRLAYHGNMTDEQRGKLHDAVSRCPIHKLMTTTDIVIETAPLDPPVTPKAAG